MNVVWGRLLVGTRVCATWRTKEPRACKSVAFSRGGLESTSNPWKPEGFRRRTRTSERLQSRVFRDVRKAKIPVTWNEEYTDTVDVAKHLPSSQ